MQRQEIPHFTREQVEQALADALELVRELELPDHLESVAFTAACTMLSAKNIQVVAPAPLELGRFPLSGSGH